MQISVLNLKRISDNPDFRLDADYAVHPYTMGAAKFNSSFLPLRDLVQYISSGHTPYHHDVSKGDVDFITIECLNDLALDTTSFKHITKSQFDTEFKTNRVVANSVLCTIKRRICKAYPFLSEPPKPTAMNQDVAFIIPKKNIDPAYLATYLCCKIGQSYAWQQKTEQMNPYISVANLARLPVAILSESFQKTIRNVFTEADKMKQESNNSYILAENFLLSELGLENYRPIHQLSFAKNFSDTQAADRIDAEYFHPMYEAVERKIRNYGSLCLGEIASTKRGSLIAESFYNNSEGVPYIRGADFSSGFLEEEKLVYIDSAFMGRSETKVNLGDIVFALIGSVGATALVSHCFNNAYISNNVGKIIVNKHYNSIILQVLLQSAIGQMYFKKVQTQTAQPKLSDKDIHSFLIPKLTPKKVEQIEKSYTQSQMNKAQGKLLIEIAKRGVELAIEKSEHEATAWIQSEIAKIQEPQL